MSEKWGWWGFDLPNRECKGTYELYPYDILPVVDINPKYKDIDNLDKLADFLHENSESVDSLFCSPTACYFEINAVTTPSVFYVDQQGVIIWCFDDDGKIVTSDGVYVAKSLPEFLSRIAIENSIWFKSETKKTYSADEIRYMIQLYENRVQVGKDATGHISRGTLE